MNTSFILACRRKKTNHIPVWYMRQAGRYIPEYRKLKERYDILTIATTPELAAEVTLMPISILRVDAAILFADIMLLPIAMGMSVRLVESVGPVIDSPIVTTPDINKLNKDGLEERLGFLSQTIRMLKPQLQVPLIGFSGAPFTLASYLIEGKPSRQFSKTKTFMYNNPQGWKRLMTKLTAGVRSYLGVQIRAGVDAVQLFDSWAGCLSRDDYEAYVLPYMKEIFTALRFSPIPLIHFATNTSAFLDRFGDVDCDVIGVDWRMSVSDVWKIIGPAKAIQGNLDPAVLLADFSCIQKKTDRIIADVNRRPGFIFNLGHGILPTTPVEQLIRLTDYVHGK